MLPIVFLAVFELGENRFQKSFSVKPTCLAVTENDFRLTNIFTFDPEMIFSPHFHFKVFPEKERERERVRARERRRPSSNQSDDRRRTPSSSPTIIGVLRAPVRRPRSTLHEIAPSITISRSVDRDLAKRRSRSCKASIAIGVKARSRSTARSR